MDRLDVINTLWFGGWLIALAVLFVLGLRLPLQPRLRRLPALGYVTGIVVTTLGLAVLANVALVLHDAHFDLTREGIFTPSKQAESVVDRLSRDVKLTYFYQSQDQEGRRAKDMVEVLGRRNPRLHVRTVDPDKQPTVADTYGVRIYNAAVLEADGRRIQVRSTDENQIALGILRVIREQVTTVCFMEGHDEYPWRTSSSTPTSRGWRVTATGRAPPRSCRCDSTGSGGCGAPSSPSATRSARSSPRP